jgi:thiamine-monophosphate kinase
MISGKIVFLSEMNAPSKEYALLKSLGRYLHFSPDATYPVGAGDDAAVMRCADGRTRIITTDTTVENTHFSLDYMTFCEVGYKAMAVNASDCAAMGARPETAFINLIIPGKARLQQRNVQEIYRGFNKACRRWGFSIAGGDISSGPCWVLAISMIGVMDRGVRPVLRTGALDGDILWVTGVLGESAAGLAALQKWGKRIPTEFKRLRQRHVSPIPRIEAGRFLAGSAKVHSMMDISDGIAKDCATLCFDNRLGAVLDIPPGFGGRPLHALAEKLGKNHLAWCLSGGEDYELLFAASPGFNPSAVARRTGVPCTRIGCLVRDKQGLFIKTKNGIQKLGPGGWDHLR